LYHPPTKRELYLKITYLSQDNFNDEEYITEVK